MNIFVGNLSFDAKEADVYKFFMPYGGVSFVSIVMDKKGRNSRGFGFLEMPDEVEAKAAIAALNGKEMMGRVLLVEQALPKEPGEGIGPRKKKERLAPEENKEGAGIKPRSRREGGYKTGRRSLSFMRKRVEAGITEPMPERKFHENPMRWRKKKPWEKKQGETKPRQESEQPPAPRPGIRDGDKKPPFKAARKPHRFKR